MCTFQMKQNVPSHSRFSSNKARLPARPFCLKGRTNQLFEIVKLICDSVGARIAIMGPGGIGKTSLAKAILYNEEVEKLVQENRFFLSVEETIDIESAATHLASLLGIGGTSEPLSAAICALEALPRSLLVIDNLESLWFSNNASAQKDTERFLQRLADIPSLTLIVTSRGSAPPHGVHWSNAQSAQLDTISLDAARETFDYIAGAPRLLTEWEALNKLLSSVDCVPLAVTLLSRLALLKNSPSQLLQRWHHNKTTFIYTRGDHRESSVDFSIRISLDLLLGMAGGAEGEHLLSICAHLPDGLRTSVYAQLLDHFADIDAAKDLLVEFALVSVGSEKELRMLSPVRHFVLKYHPMTASHLDALRKIYFAIAGSGPVHIDENFTRLAQNVAPEYGNLNSFLLYLVEPRNRRRSSLMRWRMCHGTHITPSHQPPCVRHCARALPRTLHGLQNA
ncbi:P-loop containing nucleoside triphosphate hydrolase protein [Auriculariales sp. MPI-PUGE-AT-0066]|nr:P-loop containing nucleoside triphosphate hydrolase protein [Auriculariales sp. MPI-PUGE-AT-0066]